jgi:hypothetical protein
MRKELHSFYPASRKSVETDVDVILAKTKKATTQYLRGEISEPHAYDSQTRPLLEINFARAASKNKAL